MRSIIKGLLAAVALTALAGAPAKAAVNVPLIDGAGWSEFFFGAPGFSPEFQDLSGNTLNYTFTIAPGTTDVLRVTDGFVDTEQFAVAVFDPATGLDVQPTSAPGDTGADVLNCWSCAFFDPEHRWSTGEYILGAGSYIVSGAAIVSPFGAGAGAIELGAVPEPATWAMMLAGFGGLGVMMRRARRKLATATA
jgi:hypothetical protein